MCIHVCMLTRVNGDEGKHGRKRQNLSQKRSCNRTDSIRNSPGEWGAHFTSRNQQPSYCRKNNQLDGNGEECTIHNIKKGK